MTDTLTEAPDLAARRGADAMMQHPCSPGSHPHSDRPNWEPAETANDYLRNCREGLEAYSDRRMAKLLGWSRAHLWRAKLMAEIPEDLFERLPARVPLFGTVRRGDRASRKIKSHPLGISAPCVAPCSPVLSLDPLKSIRGLRKFYTLTSTSCRPYVPALEP